MVPSLQGPLEQPPCNLFHSNQGSGSTLSQDEACKAILDHDVNLPEVRWIPKILHDPQYLIPWELWYYSILGSCRLSYINSGDSKRLGCREALTSRASTPSLSLRSDTRERRNGGDREGSCYIIGDPKGTTLGVHSSIPLP